MLHHIFVYNAIKKVVKVKLCFYAFIFFFFAFRKYKYWNTTLQNANVRFLKSQKLTKNAHIAEFV